VITFLFVCVENANRSQMAQAFAAMHGGAQVVAYRAGSRPSGVVNAKAVAAMAELGYDLRQHASKSLNEVRDQQFDYVVAIGCGDGCPFVAARHRLDWQIPDPKNLAPDEFRQDWDLSGRYKRCWPKQA
jgi:protein-tyrosine-phosphatase